MNATVVSAFTALTTADATRPLITYYDDATGERIELSVATLGNWVAKSANLLRDEHGLGPGDVAGVRLPPHWQTAAVLLGCWSAGLAVDVAPAEAPGAGFAVAFVTPAATDRSVGAEQLVEADEMYALALAPLGAAFRPGPPPGSLDYVVEVRGHGDHFASGRIDPHSPALADGTNHATLVGLAEARGLRRGARVLIDADATTDPVDWLVAPIVAGGSIVLCRNQDPAKLEARLATERAVTFPASPPASRSR